MASEFSRDWTGPLQATFNDVLRSLCGQPLRFLEVGVYEGRGACWLLDRVLTHQESRYVGIDCWPTTMRYYQGNSELVKARAYHNLAGFNLQCGYQKATIVEQASSAGLIQVLADFGPASFDVVYIDGDHTKLQCMIDTALAWPLLRVGGHLIWDDFLMQPPPEYDVRSAACLFLVLMAGELEVLKTGHQVIVRRTA